MIKGMESTHVDEAIELLQKANADLEPELLSVPEARERLKAYAQAQRLAAFGVASLARTIDEASSLARMTGTSVGKAKETIATSKILDDSAPLEAALQHGEISLDQATEIAKAEGSAPGSALELLGVAREESFHVLKEKARKAKLEAEQHRDLARRPQLQRRAGHGAHPSRPGTPRRHPDRGTGRGGGRSPRKQGQGRRDQRALRAPPRGRLCRAPVRLWEGACSPARAGGAGQPRGDPERLERGERGRGLQDPRGRPRVTRGSLEGSPKMPS